jgi:hypothetical protein
MRPNHVPDHTVLDDAKSDVARKGEISASLSPSTATFHCSEN